MLVHLLLTCSLFAGDPAASIHAEEPDDDSISADTIVVWFGDQPVYQEEVDLHRFDIESQLFIHFKSTYGIELRGHLWHEEIDGLIPVEEYEKALLESVLQARAIQALAIQHELGNSLPFPEFAAYCKNINDARVQAKTDGQVLFGNLQLSPAQLYRYQIDQLKLALLRQLRQLMPQENAETMLQDAIQKLLEDTPIRTAADA